MLKDGKTVGYIIAFLVHWSLVRILVSVTLGSQGRFVPILTEIVYSLSRMGGMNFTAFPQI